MAKSKFEQKVIKLFNVVIDLIQDIKQRADKAQKGSNNALHMAQVNKNSIDGIVNQIETLRQEIVKIEKAIQNKQVQVSVAAMPSSVKEVFKLKAIHPQTVANNPESKKSIEMRSISKINSLGLKIYAERGINNHTINAIKNVSIQDSADVVFISFKSYKRGMVNNKQKTYFVVLESKDMTTSNITELSSKGFNVIDSSYDADQIYNTLLLATRHGDLTGGIARE